MLGGSACYQEAQAHQDREDWGGHGGQPQPEVRADIFALGKVLDSCLQPAAHVVQSCQSARPLAGCWQGTAAPSSQSLAIWVLPSSCITAGLQGGCRQVETQRRLRQPGQVPSAYDLRSAHLSIHDLARWQFCRQTQSPALTAWEMSISATGPCPCPRLIMCRRSPGTKPFFSANLCSVQ